MASNKELTERMNAPAPAAVEPEAPKPKAEPKPSQHHVAEGKSVTTVRGMRHAGEAVEVRDFVHGQVTLDELVASGALVRS
jgi:hypothetical protein